MPIMRNPFRKPAGDVLPAADTESRRYAAESSLSSSEVDISKPVEFQLSEIDDSGVFITPSPTETKSFWSGRSLSSTTTSNHRSVINENEPFSISRESFDSYRRSFDISARSPIPDLSCPPPRQSLDSRLLPFASRPSLSMHRGSLDTRPPLHELEEPSNFKDVDLSEKPPQPKRRGIFGRFGGDAHDAQSNGSNGTGNAEGAKAAAGPTHHFGAMSMFTGRKRGASGTGSELRSMPRGDRAAEVGIDP